MTLIVDASVVAAALVDSGPDGTWAEEQLATHQLAAPHLMPVEVASILRQAVLAGQIAAEVAALAHADLLDLRVSLHPYEPYGSRVWDLQHDLTPYDAWYVAMAESIGAPVATLDLRLTRTAGPRCEFRSPPGSAGPAG